MAIEALDTGIIASSAPVSDAVRAGKHLWVVVVAEDPATGTIVDGDITVQTHRALENMKMALAVAGGTLKNVVQVQIFLIERADAKAMNAVYAQYFSAPYPVRATVVVKEFLAEGLRIEMTAQAVLD